jgi:lysozyme
MGLSGVNDHLFTNAHGLRLITQFEGKPRLNARLCEGGAWELGYGVTFDLNGNPFKEGDTCTEDEALAYFRNALTRFEEAVKKHVTVELNSNQFSALVAFAYNVGEANLARSSVLRLTNARWFDDAADAFGMWVYATLGQHKQALRGLLRRRYAEALLFMGYDWELACSDEAVALVRERPPNDVGTDKVLFKTPFKDVLSVAQRYPLPPLDEPELVLNTPAPAPKAGNGAAPASPPSPVQAPAPKPSVGGSSEAAPVKPTVPAPQPVPTVRPAPASVPAKVQPPAPVGTKPPSDNTKMPEHVPYRIDPTAGLKPMEETERFVGAALMLFGTFARVIMANGTALTGVGGVIVVGILDMMKSPTNLAILVTLIAMAITGVLWVFAFMIDKLGLKIKKRGEKSASQAMY